MVSITIISVIFALLVALVKPNEIGLSNDYETYILEEDTLSFKDVDHYLVFQKDISFNISNICDEM